MSKGSRQRTLNTKRFNDNYDSIFGDKNESNRAVPREKAGKSTNSQAGKPESKERTV